MFQKERPLQGGQINNALWSQSQFLLLLFFSVVVHRNSESRKTESGLINSYRLSHVHHAGLCITVVYTYIQEDS